MPSAPARATIIDVAELAGVSRQTVTRALNDLADVKPSTKERVVAAARTLNYRPNRAAQSLVQGRRTIIGFVVDDLGNPYFAELASALSREAAEHEWSVLLCDVGFDGVKGRAQLATMVQRVDAVMLTGCRRDTLAMLPEDVLRGDGLRMPLIMLDGPANPRLDARIVLDVDSAIAGALAYLTGSGRRNIAFIDSTEGSDDRRTSYRTHLAAHALPGLSARESAAPETIDGGAKAADDILQRWPDTDAVLVYNDVMAIGVLKALARAGRSVPGQIAVIGIDGLDIGRALTPELTTLAIDKAALARTAIAALNGVMGSGATAAGAAAVRTVELSLIQRESA